MYLFCNGRPGKLFIKNSVARKLKNTENLMSGFVIVMYQAVFPGVD